MRLKRICCVIAAVLMLGTSLTGLAETQADVNNAVFELSSLGIFTGDEDGSLNLSDTMTRAEFAKIAAVLTGCDEVAAGTATVSRMADVSASHWAVGYIEYCVGAGLMRGDGDGTFRPEDTITLEECVKTLVVIMGYEMAAEEQGGYPGGYHAVAVRKHLLSGVNGAQSEPAVRRDILFLIWNALDVPNLVSDYAEEKSYREDPDTTIRRTIEKAKELSVTTGVVTANSEIWLNQENISLTAGQIEIDGRLFDVNKDMAAEAAGFIGQEVTAYYRYNDRMRYPLIYNIQPTVHNTVTEIRAEDIQSFTGSEIRYWADGQTKERKIRLAGDTRFVYNDRLETRFLEDFAGIESGDIRVIDNNGDNQTELVFINEYESFVVEKANANGNLKVKYLGREDGELTVRYDNILLDMTEDNAYTIKDAAGEAVAYEDLKKGMVVSVFENNQDSFIRVVCSGAEVLTGTVSAKDEDNKVRIGEETYQTDRDEVYQWIMLGEAYDFYFDAYGRIVYAEQTKANQSEESAWKYGYIYQVSEKTFGQMEVLLLNAGKVENREEENLEDRTDTAVVPVTLCKNDSVVTLEVADTVSVDGVSLKEAGIGQLQGKPIRYTTNAAGELRRVQSLEEAGGSDRTKYNAKEKVFGTVNVLDRRPFLINESTRVVCVPDNGTTNTDDLMVRLSLDNKDELIEYNAFGYDLDEETKAVKLLVLTKEMAADTVTRVTPSQAKVALIKDAALALDEEGQEYMILTMLVGTELKETSTLPIQDRPALRQLKRGDFVFYMEDADGKVENAQVVNNVYAVQEGDYGDNNPDYKQVIGYVQDIRMNEINNNDRIRVNQLDVVTAGGLEYVDVPISNYPDIFIYYTRNDAVEAGTIEDIVPYPVPAADPEQVLIVSTNTAIRGIVIIK